MHDEVIGLLELQLVISECKVIDDHITVSFVFKVLELQPMARRNKGRQIVKEEVICVGGIIVFFLQLLLWRTK